MAGVVGSDAGRYASDFLLNPVQQQINITMALLLSTVNELLPEPPTPEAAETTARWAVAGAVLVLVYFMQRDAAVRRAWHKFTILVDNILTQLVTGRRI